MRRPVLSNALCHSIAYGPVIDQLLDAPGEQDNSLGNIFAIDESGHVSVGSLDGRGHLTEMNLYRTGYGKHTESFDPHVPEASQHWRPKLGDQERKVSKNPVIIPTVAVTRWTRKEKDKTVKRYPDTIPFQQHKISLNASLYV